MDLKNILTVSKPSLPKLEDYVDSLQEIWDNRYLTNFGVFHVRFEKALCEYLNSTLASLFCNGTIALQIGLQALRITGEVITTPFTFPATVHSIYWSRCKPVFCDIDPKSFCLSPEHVEALITPETTAILPVHVYGRPCDVEGIQRIADTYGLKVFYDAAHAFGIKLPGGTSIFDHGDLSMISFHATKVFNTVEGGALITSDIKLKKRIDYLMNFGIADETTNIGPGSNGKMNELIAAFGLLLLGRIEECIEQRKKLDSRYRENLKNISGITVPPLPEDVKNNYGYFPVLIEENFGKNRDELFQTLKMQDIFARPYFYPLVSNTPCYRQLPSAFPKKLPVATAISEKVLCLPIYEGLTLENVDRICSIIEKSKYL